MFASRCACRRRLRLLAQPLGSTTLAPTSPTPSSTPLSKTSSSTTTATTCAPMARTAASAAASFLVSHPDIRVLIGGYADERGSAEYNLALGENRANSAKTALINAGVAPTRIRVVSYGKEKQFCTESNEECWQENPPRPVHHRSLTRS